MEILGFEFQNPGRLWLLAGLLLMILWYVYKERDRFASVKYSTAQGLEAGTRTARVYLRHILFVFRVVAMSLLIIALARPRRVVTSQNISTEGIDIILAIDISPSMLAEDFSPNRLEAAKKVAIQFISGRPNDRIGVVAFGGESFTVSPLTTDHATVINMLRKLREGMVQDGTAIGLGLANAVARLKDSKAKSKVVILLTDGVNNRGNISPLTAAQMASSLGIRVYTIGVGSSSYANIPVNTPFGVEYQKVKVQVDEHTLKEIAQMTGGKYFRATNEQKLMDIYKEIDKLEKTKFKEHKQVFYKEEYKYFVAWALLLLVLELLLRRTIFRVFP